MARVELTDSASQGLDEIFDYVARQSRSATIASAVVRRIAEKCQLYATQPLLGEVRADLGLEIRCFRVDNHVAIYEPIADGIRVLLVIDGRRDVPAVFRQVFGP